MLLLRDLPRVLAEMSAELHPAAFAAACSLSPAALMARVQEAASSSEELRWHDKLVLTKTLCDAARCWRGS
jgi:hypothetical protein